MHPHLVHPYPMHPQQQPFLIQPCPHPCPPAHHMPVGVGLVPAHAPPPMPMANVGPIPPPFHPPPHLRPHPATQQSIQSDPTSNLYAVPVGSPHDIVDPGRGTRRPPEPLAAPKPRHDAPPAKRARPSSSVRAPIADDSDDGAQHDDRRGHANVAPIAADQVHYSYVTMKL